MPGLPRPKGAGAAPVSFPLRVQGRGWDSAPPRREEVTASQRHEGCTSSGRFLGHCCSQPEAGTRPGQAGDLGRPPLPQGGCCFWVTASPIPSQDLVPTLPVVPWGCPPQHPLPQQLLQGRVAPEHCPPAGLRPGAAVCPVHQRSRFQAMAAPLLNSSWEEGPFCALGLYFAAPPSRSQSHIPDWGVPGELGSLAGAFGLQLAALGYPCPVGPGTGRGGVFLFGSGCSALPELVTVGMQQCSVPACQALVSF